MTLRIMFALLGAWAMFAGIWPAALLAWGGVVFDLVYLQPGVDAADAAVEAAGVSGNDGRGEEGCATVALTVVAIAVLVFGTMAVMGR